MTAPAVGWRKFYGVAATTGLDKHRERLAEDALFGAARQAKGVALVTVHRGLADIVGKVLHVTVDGGVLTVEGLVNPQALSRCGHGLSIGGRVLRSHWEFDREAGQVIRVIDEVALDHIAICPHCDAANPQTSIGLEEPA